MLREMSGKRTSVQIPVVVEAKQLVMTNAEEAHLLEKMFASM